MEVVRVLGEDALDAVPGDNVTDPKSNRPQNSSIYTMACDESLMNRQVEQWMGNLSPTQTTGIQGSRPTLMQRSTLVTDMEAPFPDTSVWHMLALMTQLLNIAATSQWRCSQNAVLNFMELISSQMARACSRLRCNTESLFHSHFTRDIFATAMDVVLLIYAIGFLIISVYQAGIVPINS
ncbi:uncharacterized protein LOC123868910 isoform X2 [Maniola jurtina]|uniref:uncharacterized protein LOC123868910 isoform X2 n=1 Tax=Maniola jurtina TaxID=191418 RepID=UPI001E6875DC|nr:uncharacterized protein LOC123868910 isoform X2 [Maniola jurtina]